MNYCKESGSVFRYDLASYDLAGMNEFLKRHEFNYRWLSKKVHIQSVGFF